MQRTSTLLIDVSTTAENLSWSKFFCLCWSTVLGISIHAGCLQSLNVSKASCGWADTAEMHRYVCVSSKSIKFFSYLGVFTLLPQIRSTLGRPILEGTGRSSGAGEAGAPGHDHWWLLVGSDTPHADFLERHTRQHICSGRTRIKAFWCYLLGSRHFAKLRSDGVFLAYYYKRM